MGLSLADAAVSGTRSTKDIAEQKQTLLSAGDTEGLIALNHTLFGCATMMAKEDDADDDADDDDDDDEDDEDSDDDEDDDGDDDDEDDKGKRKKKQDPRDVRIQELSAEAKKRRLRTRKDRERIEALEAENARLKKGKGKPKDKDDEDDDSEEESEDLIAEREKNKALEARLQQQTLRTEFNDILTSPKTKIKFIDPKAAFRLLDLDDVEIDEDGEVDGMLDAIKALAKKSPYLVEKPKKADDEDDEDDEDEDKPRRRRTGQRTGGGRKGKPNTEALKKKYNIQR